jgi:hypothetical protein
MRLAGTSPRKETYGFSAVMLKRLSKRTVSRLHLGLRVLTLVWIVSALYVVLAAPRAVRPTVIALAVLSVLWCALVSAAHRVAADAEATDGHLP